MPEGPEVETVRRTLAPFLAGREIIACSILDTRLTRPLAPRLLAGELVGKTVVNIRRHGKYLDLCTDAGGSLLVHLRMTGQLIALPANQPPERPHLRAHALLDNGSSIIYCDIRRFGTWQWFSTPKALTEFLTPRVGVDAASDAFTGAHLYGASRGRRTAIRSLLLDQRTCAGSGNIYTLEALWQAGVNPARAAASLSLSECELLAGSLREILAAAVIAGGSSVSDYRDGTGQSGTMQEQLQVYGRAGLPCPRCQGVLAHATIGGRGSIWCPACQPEE